jgi:hypothetical protein
MPGTPSREKSFPRRHPDLAFRSIGEDGGLVVLPGKAEVKVLNPVAIKIFSLLDGEHSAEQIAEAVTEEFDVTQEQALRDVNDFLDELRRHEMLAPAKTS